MLQPVLRAVPGNLHGQMREERKDVIQRILQHIPPDVHSHRDDKARNTPAGGFSGIKKSRAGKIRGNISCLNAHPSNHFHERILISREATHFLKGLPGSLAI